MSAEIGVCGDWVSAEIGCLRRLGVCGDWVSVRIGCLRGLGVCGDWVSAGTVLRDTEGCQQNRPPDTQKNRPPDTHAVPLTS